jgi:hypothetical protein
VFVELGELVRRQPKGGRFNQALALRWPLQIARQKNSMPASAKKPAQPDQAAPAGWC